MKMQELYFDSLTQYKFELFYYEAYFRYAYILDNAIKIFLALVTAELIANWAIWEKLAVLWAALIAISQVIQVINSYLPYARRVETLGPLHKSLEELYVEMEHDYIDTLIVKVDPQTLNDRRTKYQKKWDELENTALLKDAIPRKILLLRKADLAKIQYFENMLVQSSRRTRAKKAAEEAEEVDEGSEEDVEEGAEVKTELFKVMVLPQNPQTGSFRMPSQQTKLRFDEELFRIQ